MTYGGEGLYREAALMDGDDDIFRPAGLGGDGWWDDAVKETKRVAKRVQKSKAVRGLPDVSKPIVCNGLREIKVYSESEHAESDVPVRAKEDGDETEQITGE